MSVQERRLTIAASLGHVEEACDFVAGVARSAGMGDDAIYHCYLSVEEVCTNIVEHGYRYKGDDQVIEIICRPTAKHLKIIVIDDAKPFDPLKLSDPDPKAPLIERQGGGWGIFFVKKYMDRVTYRYADDRNQFIMEKDF